MPYVSRQTIYEAAAVVAVVVGGFAYATGHSALATFSTLAAIPLAVLAR